MIVVFHSLYNVILAPVTVDVVICFKPHIEGEVVGVVIMWVEDDAHVVATRHVSLTIAGEEFADTFSDEFPTTYTSVLGGD